jgi:hypothetical protein
MDEQLGQENRDILIIQGAIIVIWSAGEVVSLIGGARLIDKFEVEFGHCREIASNTAANFLGVAVILQVGVIGEDTDLVR